MGMPGMKAQRITLVLEGADPHLEIQLLEFDPDPRDRSGVRTRPICDNGASVTSRSALDIEAATAHLVANGATALSDEMDYISRSCEGSEGITFELL